MEHELICFVALMTGTNKFHSLLCRLDSNLRLEPAIGLIATAMGRSRTLIRDALNPRAPLAQSGLIRVDPDFSDLLCGFNCIEGLENILMRPYASRAELTAAFLHQPPAGNLSLEDFEHLRVDANLLLAYLGGALERGDPGTNILLYGPPGVGKTEFTLALARKLDARIYEVRTEDADGDSPTRDARLSSYMLGQRFLCKTPRAMLLFDEIEDVFGEPGYAPRSGRGTQPLSKAWVNRLLESNPVPAVWITNSLCQMDPAFRRRFDYCLEFPRPPLQTRRRFVQDLLTPLGIGRKVTDVMATDEYLSPAIVQKARKLVVRAGKAPAEQRNEMALLVYRNASRVLG
ncbi:MAG: AAA family ATPase, partial [Gammaproteobacteria bacterium]|nr:AAA family ATPase [Gammaproteobacteria bacterium]